MSGFFVLLLNGGDTVIHAVMLCGNFILLAFDDFVSSFLRHKVRLSAAKPSDLFLELTKNPLELTDCSA